MKDTGVWDLKEAKTQHAFSERLAKIISTNFSGLIYDVGCGPGHYVDFLRKDGHNVIGIEGTDFQNGNIVHDLTEPLPILDKGTVLCLEVAEHIPKQYESMFLDNVTSLVDKYLLISWAVKGQGGHGHVNEQDRDYVLRVLNERGYKLLHNQTDSIRKAMEGDRLWWFANSLYLFEK